MKHYVIATQQPWGARLVEQVRRDNETWALEYYPGAHTSKMKARDRLSASIRNLDPRYVFCVNWSTMISVVTLRKAECVNFHCTALPYGRGGGPIENLIIRGHTDTVITAHRMVEEVDAGPIYGVSGPVSLAGTKEQILDRFVDPVVELVRWIVTEEPEPYPQVGEVVTFKRLPKAEYEAFWKARA